MANVWSLAVDVHLAAEHMAKDLTKDFQSIIAFARFLKQHVPTREMHGSVIGIIASLCPGYPYLPGQFIR